jgi:hypothetical protein
MSFNSCFIFKNSHHLSIKQDHFMMSATKILKTHQLCVQKSSAAQNCWAKSKMFVVQRLQILL